MSYRTVNKYTYGLVGADTLLLRYEFPPFKVRNYLKARHSVEDETHTALLYTEPEVSGFLNGLLIDETFHTKFLDKIYTVTDDKGNFIYLGEHAQLFHYKSQSWKKVRSLSHSDVILFIKGEGIRESCPVSIQKVPLSDSVSIQMVEMSVYNPPNSFNYGFVTSEGFYFR